MLHTHQLIHCRSRREIKQFIRYAWRAVSANTLPNSMRVPLMTNFIQLILNYVHETEPQTVGFFAVTGMISPKVDQLFKEVNPPLAVMIPIE